MTQESTPEVKQQEGASNTENDSNVLQLQNRLKSESQQKINQLKEENLGLKIDIEHRLKLLQEDNVKLLNQIREQQQLYFKL